MNNNEKISKGDQNGGSKMSRAAVVLILSLVAGLFTVNPHEARAQTATDPSRASTILVFDVSNSMWGQIEGRSKIEIAREVIGDLLYDWDPDVDLGLVAYGHRRAGDCGDIQEVIPVGPVNPGSFSKIVNSLVPRGKTPLTEAVREAAEILNYRDSRATVILVSDGIESCKADPCALAEELERGGIDFTAHVVGFDVGRIEDQRQLSCLADDTGGRYLTADSAGELLSALQTVAAPPPPMLRLEAAETEHGPAINDPSIRWTVVDLGSEETVLGGESMAAPELEVEAGRYVARAELGEGVGSIEFDYSGDADVLKRVVLKFAPAATLDGPAEVEAGSAFKVDWTGPDAKGDFVAIVEADAREGEAGSYAYTRKGSPAEMRAPDAPGPHELRYISAQTRKTVARVAIMVVPAAATLDAPPTAAAGANIPVAWTGPDNQNDFITIVPAGTKEGKHGNYTYTRKGNPLELQMPDEAGAYEMRYVTGQERMTLATLPITVTAVLATLEATPTIGAGALVKVTWTGPDNQNDFITIVPAGTEEGKHGNYTYTRKGNPMDLHAPDETGAHELRYVSGQSRATLARLPIAITIVPAGAKEGKHGNYTYTRKGNPMELRAPDETGAHELRYVSGQSRATLARLPIAVTAVTAELEAPPVVPAGGNVKIVWTGPDNQNDFITIVPAGTEEGKHGNYTYTRKGSPLEVKAPDRPGAYELRYVTGQSRTTLTSLPITVN
jgi:Ca-activated chloride channel family protein